MVKDNDADVNHIGNIAAQQMNVIQVNHENLHVLPGSSKDVRVVQASSEMSLSERKYEPSMQTCFKALENSIPRG